MSVGLENSQALEMGFPDREGLDAADHETLQGTISVIDRNGANHS